MVDIQKQADLALAELDIVEEMLRPLVTAKEIHERGDCFHIPIRAGFFQSDGVFGKGTKRLNRRPRATDA